MGRLETSSTFYRKLKDFKEFADVLDAVQEKGKVVAVTSAENWKQRIKKGLDSLLL